MLTLGQVDVWSCRRIVFDVWSSTSGRTLTIKLSRFFTIQATEAKESTERAEARITNLQNLNHQIIFRLRKSNLQRIVKLLPNKRNLFLLLVYRSLRFSSEGVCPKDFSLGRDFMLWPSLKCKLRSTARDSRRR